MQKLGLEKERLVHRRSNEPCATNPAAQSQKPLATCSTVASIDNKEFNQQKAPPSTCSFSSLLFAGWRECCQSPSDLAHDVAEFIMDAIMDEASQPAAEQGATTEQGLAKPELFLEQSIEKASNSGSSQKELNTAVERKQAEPNLNEDAENLAQTTIIFESDKQTETSTFLSSVEFPNLNCVSIVPRVSSSSLIRSTFKESSRVSSHLLSLFFSFLHKLRENCFSRRFCSRRFRSGRRSKRLHLQGENPPPQQQPLLESNVLPTQSSTDIISSDSNIALLSKALPSSLLSSLTSIEIKKVSLIEHANSKTINIMLPCSPPNSFSSSPQLLAVRIVLKTGSASHMSLLSELERRGAKRLLPALIAQDCCEKCPAATPLLSSDALLSPQSLHASKPSFEQHISREPNIQRNSIFQRKKRSEKRESKPQMGAWEKSTTESIDAEIDGNLPQQQRDIAATTVNNEQQDLTDGRAAQQIVEPMFDCISSNAQTTSSSGTTTIDAQTTSSSATTTETKEIPLDDECPQSFDVIPFLNPAAAGMGVGAVALMSKRTAVEFEKNLRRTRSVASQTSDWLPSFSQAGKSRVFHNASQQGFAQTSVFSQQSGKWETETVLSQGDNSRPRAVDVLNKFYRMGITSIGRDVWENRENMERYEIILNDFEQPSTQVEDNGEDLD